MTVSSTGPLGTTLTSVVVQAALSFVIVVTYIVTGLASSPSEMFGDSLTATHEVPSEIDACSHCGVGMAKLVCDVDEGYTGIVQPRGHRAPEAVRDCPSHPAPVQHGADRLGKVALIPRSLGIVDVSAD